jgi:hypothetical protein
MALHRNDWFDVRYAIQRYQALQAKDGPSTPVAAA